ncbi:hypothetical protein EVAR_17678_1 [Eumeta japonica]|uniref:Uncharacterized protein n=1 Tax=Eumeta variegata TaxID=151549 RepID=A0A4C1USE2_EUMVA|nr:hypothetical protein EVAR_17678_1 [Eumeta japonica]
MERKLTREDFMRKSFRSPRATAPPAVEEPAVNGAPPPSPVSLAMLERGPQPQRAHYEFTATGIAPKKLELNRAHPIHLKSFRAPEPPDGNDLDGDTATAAPPSDDLLRKLERQIGEMERGLERTNATDAKTSGAVAPPAVDERVRYAEHENLLRTGVSAVGGGGYLPADSDTEHDAPPFNRNESTRNSTGGATAVPASRPATRLARTHSDTQQHTVAATAKLMRKLADAGTDKEEGSKANGKVLSRKAVLSRMERVKNSVVGARHEHRVLAEHRAPPAGPTSPPAPAQVRQKHFVINMTEKQSHVRYISVLSLSALCCDKPPGSLFSDCGTFWFSRWRSVRADVPIQPSPLATSETDSLIRFPGHTESGLIMTPAS